MKGTRIRNLAVLIALAGVVAIGCSKSTNGSGATTPSPTAGTKVTVTYQNTAIQPVTETVAVGTTIVWENAETNGVIHNVTSGTVEGTTPHPDGKFASAQVLNPGQKYEHTFTAAGTYHYYCSVHPTQMQGTIIVQ